MTHIATINLGVNREPSTVYPIRTPEQRAAVAAIATSPEFAFACHNPFDALTRDHFAARGREYTGPFVFLWSDTAGELHATRIGKRGNILRHLVCDVDGNVRAVR